MSAETTFDISADLDELAKTPVIVVSAGPKAIQLDAAAWPGARPRVKPVIQSPLSAFSSATS